MDRKLTISVCMIVKNEEHNLPACLESVQPFASEIVIVDTGSTDSTVEIARSYSAKVHLFNWTEDFASAKNEALSHATSDWIFLLDADERITPDLATETLTLIQDKHIDAYAIPRRNYIFGEWIKTMDWWPDYQIRLFRNGKVHFKNIIHEHAEVEGRTQWLPLEIKLALVHLNYTSVFSFVEKLNRYTTAIAKDLQASGVKFHWWHLLYWPLREFVKRYIYYEGFRQGIYGLLLSMMMAFYYFVIRAKLWEIQRGEKRV
jgi:glycosyltransferase involved in cell wall biosynthesis